MLSRDALVAEQNGDLTLASLTGVAVTVEKSVEMMDEFNLQNEVPPDGPATEELRVVEQVVSPQCDPEELLRLAQEAQCRASRWLVSL